MTKRSDAHSRYPEPGQIIAGAWLPTGDRQTGEVMDPTTGTVLGSYAQATDADIDKALAAAASGFAIWRAMSAHARGRILHEVARTMRDRREALAELVTLELGKPWAEALGEVEQAAGMWEWAAEEGKRAYGRIIPSREDGGRQMVLVEPLGPIAAFGSWNAPLITPSRKMAGALGAGCSIVLKASEEVPACALAIGRIAIDCGLPEGALSILTGDAVHISDRLLDAPQIKGISFTGSTRIGKILAAKAVSQMKRPIMELGGHAPVLIFDDVDVEALAKTAVAAKFRNSGQICICPTRFLVQRGVYAAFTEALTDLAKDHTLGDGFDENVKMGPVIDPRRIASMDDFITDAKTRGLKVTTGGNRLDREGFFYAPTVIADVTPDALVANVEPFGPIAALAPFDTYDEAIAQANCLPFALAAYVHSENVHTIHKAVNDVQAGSVICNGWRVSLPETPFGGVKDSGLFQEGGIEGLRAFQNVKFAYVA
ncbi:NAD-dependent succinate-semialdehyde dehydrogenase [Pseudooceanicola sp.]|uniref:NAD-dependent succinate-semialdehyde dehydrogenase n=1 Tax=Pseudooceanicola sp. TaxID=1914328 RepID=UPI0026254101|nr:NAD-dependent succinate-semialdehyde dehydrogenase [Pseudooceanicola sp.]MDF1855038.1 NAD-dependent succinate-semialdehyde dehydrogenase [Pseudooceanicola sp.]